MGCELAGWAEIRIGDAPSRALSNVCPRRGGGLRHGGGSSVPCGDCRAASNLPTIIPEGARKTKSDDNTIHWEDCGHGMEEVKAVWNKSLGPAARRQTRTLSLRCQRFWCKDKVMENGHARPLSPALPSAAPQVIFANWRETLHLLKLGRGLKHTYTQAIEGYLHYCLRNGLRVGVESARGFVADALRRAAPYNHLGHRCSAG
jgi:hypothetical protein